MRLFGLDISLRRKAVPPMPPNLSGVDDSRGWLRIFDWRPGAWQQHAEHEVTDVFAQTTVFACITLIASDIGKLRVRLVEKDGRIWRETTSPAYSPVLRKPNHYQTRQKFIEGWIVSKLSEGNTYTLKQRDLRGVVTSMYVLDPRRVQPLVAPDGAVYYRVAQDDLNRLPTDIEAIPAAEIIHDRMVCLFHPLVGVTPLYAATLPALQALQIQNKSKSFFANGSQPGGILSAPAKISEETARRIKDHWERNYTGTNVGRVAVLGDGLAYTPGTVNAVDSQLVEQLGLTAKQICAAFHVPPFLVGAADAPPYGNIGPAVQQYYNQCLQTLIESLEASLDEGLGIGEGVKVEGRELGTDLDLDQLLRMDKRSQAEVEGLLVQRGIHSPDESREVFGKPPVDGGGQPYLQQQNYSLAALARRDGRDDPFGSASPPPALPAPMDEDDDEAAAEKMSAAVQAGVAPVALQVAEVAATVQQLLQAVPAADERIAAALAQRLAPVDAQLEDLAAMVQQATAAQVDVETRLAGAVQTLLSPVAQAVQQTSQRVDELAQDREAAEARRAAEAEQLRQAADAAEARAAAVVQQQLAPLEQRLESLAGSVQGIAEHIETRHAAALQTLLQPLTAAVAEIDAKTDRLAQRKAAEAEQAAETEAVQRFLSELTTRFEQAELVTAET